MKNLIKELEALLKNKIVSGAAIFALTFIICSSHTGRSTDQQRTPAEKTIQVTGSCEMSITPDEMEFIIGINEYYESSSFKKSGSHEALKDLNKVESQVREKLISLGVKKEDIKTELFVNSYWYWNENQQTNMTKQLKFKVSDFSTISKFVNEIDIKGLQYMRMGELSHKKILEYRKQVKMDALKAAKEKAAYLLESIGKKAGDIISITESPDRSSDGNWWGYYWPQYGSNSNMLSNSAYSSTSDNGANSEVRSIKLRYEVQSTFEIIN